MGKKYWAAALCIGIVLCLTAACQSHGREAVTPDGYTLAGEVEEVDNRNYPVRDWAECRLQKGQESYADDDKMDAVCAAYDKGSAKFSVSAEEQSEGGEQVYFDGEWYDADKLSDETLEWLQMYNGLPEKERRSLSHIPWDLWELSGAADEEDVRAEETASETDQEGALGVELEAADVTAAGLTLICRQPVGHVSGELQTGTAYFLEKEEDGEWAPVESLQELIWEDIALPISRDGNTEWKIDWSASYGLLSRGRYRIGKEITIFRAAGDYDTAVCYAEFEI